MPKVLSLSRRKQKPPQDLEAFQKKRKAREEEKKQKKADAGEILCVSRVCVCR